KPDNADAHSNLGGALSAKGDMDGAIASSREAVRLKPGYALAHSNLGAVLSATGDKDGAIASFREAIRLEPDYAQAHFNLGIALGAKGDLDGAIASYREATRLKPDYAKAHFNVGSVLTVKGDLDGAMWEYREAIRLDPNDFASHFNLGNALRDTGDIQGAAASYREAIRLKPDHAESHYALGNALAAKGDPDGAIASFREAIRLKPDYAEPHCNLGHALTGQGHFREALPWLRKGHEIGSKRPDWVYPSKEWIEDAERKTELEGRLDQVLSGGERPRDAVERITFALMLYAKSRHAQSVQMWAQAFAEHAGLAEDLVKNHRYNAACSAALAAASGGRTPRNAAAGRSSGFAPISPRALGWRPASLPRSSPGSATRTSRASATAPATCRNRSARRGRDSGPRSMRRWRPPVRRRGDRGPGRRGIPHDSRAPRPRSLPRFSFPAWHAPVSDVALVGVCKTH
ncbi:MAG: tetratricopeptide repeat protein, partial [Planctomycetota bacterium]